MRVGSSPTWGTMAIRTDILERKSDILKWVDDQEPKAEIARRLGCKIDTLNSYLGKMNIEYKGNQGGWFESDCRHTS